MTRLGIDITSLTHARTGVGNYTHNLLKHLLIEGSELSIRGFTSGVAPLDLEGIDDLEKIRRVPIPTRALYRLWSGFNRPRVDSLLGGVDLFHATNYVLPPVKSAKRVVTFHDLSFLHMPEYSSPKIVTMFSRHAEEYAQGADHIIACSQATKRDIEELLHVEPSKVTVVYEGADEIFAPVDNEEARKHVAEHYGIETPYLLFVGTLEPRKNIEASIEAFADVASDISHSLILVGREGWNPPDVDRLVQQHGLQDRVKQIGYVASDTELPYLYSGADLFLFPSHYEGFGLPLLEAMACGCPAITSNAGSLPEVGGAAVRYVDPKDGAKPIAAAIMEIVDDQRIQDEMRRLGIAQAKQFSWQSCARETMAVYRHVCS